MRSDASNARSSPCDANTKHPHPLPLPTTTTITATTSTHLTPSQPENPPRSLPNHNIPITTSSQPQHPQPRKYPNNHPSHPLSGTNRERSLNLSETSTPTTRDHHQKNHPLIHLSVPTRRSHLFASLHISPPLTHVRSPRAHLSRGFRAHTSSPSLIKAHTCLPNHRIPPVRSLSATTGRLHRPADHPHRSSTRDHITGTQT